MNKKIFTVPNVLLAVHGGSSSHIAAVGVPRLSRLCRERRAQCTASFTKIQAAFFDYSFIFIAGRPPISLR